MNTMSKPGRVSEGSFNKRAAELFDLKSEIRLPLSFELLSR